MKIYNDVLNNLIASLDFLESEQEDILRKSEEGIKVTKRALEQLRNIVIKKEFSTIQEEIEFFKIIKPQVFSKLIYFHTLFNIESKRPRSSTKTQIKYFNKHIDRLQNYFNDHLEFYHYYRRGATFLDEHYFIRGKIDIRLFPDSFAFYIDDKFSTSHDSTVASILAYDMLIIYLQSEIKKLENNNGMEASANTLYRQSNLFWTATKTDLIELIYALDSVGAVNKGTTDIKQLAMTFEQFFNIDLGDFYRAYLEIRSRKINQTKFIDKLKETLSARMDNADE